MLKHRTNICKRQASHSPRLTQTIRIFKSSVVFDNHARNSARTREYDLDVVEMLVHVGCVHLDHQQKLAHSVQTVEPGRQPSSRPVAVLAGMVPEPNVMCIRRGQGA
jgi:hypothetical protein